MEAAEYTAKIIKFQRSMEKHLQEDFREDKEALCEMLGNLSDEMLRLQMCICGSFIRKNN